MQRPLMQQVNAEPDENVIQQRPLMSAEQQQAAEDDEVNADDAEQRAWTYDDDEVNADDTFSSLAPDIWTI